MCSVKYLQKKPQKNNSSLLFSKPLSIKTASGFTEAEFS
ncbi:hypothetical protein P20439_1448 [Pseudoalteromonas sp. BSi20439]|nr:hypothetical protein P20439_1448 [Pseudoalteromonas sp. BSi20439]